MEYITKEEIRELFRRPRKRDASKGDFGRALVVAGSRGMAGAAVLCARGALRAGAGLVTLSVPNEILPIIQIAVPEAICISRELSADILASYDAVAIGPGLGVSEKTLELVLFVLENYGGVMVLDADALNVIAGTGVTFDEDTIITPHAGEAARLLGTDIRVVREKREASAAVLAERYGCTAVLKGAGTIVAVSGSYAQRYINPTGNPGMATGGSGDVLAGVIASFAAQGMPSLEAARAGVYIHGLAGDIAAAEIGERGISAGDLPLSVALALKQISE